ncbi:MAG: rod shape-determining protein MreD [Candidatus Aminicenantes bacterium]|nr:rod shape-determining protein MreD [Candidatus Aminicenantes bacterium]
MRNFVEISIGIIIAFFLYTIIGKISFSLSQLLNFFTLAVIYFAITKGELYGACIGTVCGLIQDSFSLGVFGISGLSKTLIGFLAGFIAQRINVLPLVRNFLFILVLIIGETALSLFLYYFISAEYAREITPLILFQPLCTAILGSIVFLFLRKFRVLSF